MVNDRCDDINNWTKYEGGGSVSVVEGPLGGHYNYLKISCLDANEDYCWANQAFDSGQTSGSIYYSFRYNTPIGNTYYQNAKNEVNANSIRIYEYYTTNKLYAYDGAAHYICDVAVDTWYDIEWVFDCSIDQFDCIVNGENKGTYNFYYVATTLNAFRCHCSDKDTDYDMLIDKLYYSWDSPSNTGWKNAQTITSEDRNGRDSWINPTNAQTSDDNDTNTHPNYDYSDWLRAVNFNMGVPEGATIDGIIVDIERKGETANNLRDSSVRLRDSSGQVGDERRTLTWWGTSDEYEEHGGVSYNWNAGLSAADVNNSNFGVDISAYSPNGQYYAYIDHVRIKVYYSEVAGWNHKINGVANADISKVNGILKSNINKVNGVS